MALDHLRIFALGNALGGYHCEPGRMPKARFLDKGVLALINLFVFIFIQIIICMVTHYYSVKIASLYGGAGQMFDYTQYKKYEADVLSSQSIKPAPREDSFIWVLGTPLKPNSSENIVYIISLEGENEAYIYLYYSRK